MHQPIYGFAGIAYGIHVGSQPRHRYNVIFGMICGLRFREVLIANDERLKWCG